MNFRTLNMILLLCLLTGTAMLKSTPGFAEAQYNIKVMTPDVQAALEARKNRYEKLRELKDKGLIGENNHGYVEALVDDLEAKSIVEAENQNRKSIYKTIEEQNNLTNALSTIEKVFAQVQRDKAVPGDKFQQDDGKWSAK